MTKEEIINLIRYKMDRPDAYDLSPVEGMNMTQIRKLRKHELQVLSAKIKYKNPTNTIKRG